MLTPEGLYASAHICKSSSVAITVSMVVMDNVQYLVSRFVKGNDPSVRLGTYLHLHIPIVQT
jgi:hypothetical protein